MLIVAEAMHDQAASDVRTLTAALAAELAASWPSTPQTAVLSAAEPRFTAVRP